MTPIIKNRRFTMNLCKGEIPITKNVSVVDEYGKEYEATYIKRAKGLVKNGRARFIDENRICLACPPNEFLEDKEMDNSTISNINSTEIIEYAKQKIDRMTIHYENSDRSSAFDAEVITSITNAVTILMKTVVKLEAIAVLAKVDAIDSGIQKEIVSSLQNVINS